MDMLFKKLFFFATTTGPGVSDRASWSKILKEEGARPHVGEGQISIYRPTLACGRPMICQAQKKAKGARPEAAEVSS
jgi:hypothetical protein